jgi:heme-degrading monooxygenase HmoA
MPGFEEFMLLRPLAGDDRCFVVTRCESEDAYQNWRTSQQFQHQHASTHTDGGRGEAKPDHPVATGASLLEFEVVLLAPMSRCAHLAVGSRRCGTDRPEIRGDLGR